jgi:hypothetical protein
MSVIHKKQKKQGVFENMKKFKKTNLQSLKKNIT